MMDVQPWRSSSALSPGAHAEREVAGGTGRYVVVGL